MDTPTLDTRRAPPDTRPVARVLLENLSKTFAGPKHEVIHAVSELDLAIVDQEFFVLVGPSGCGKTTTLRLIAGLETPSQGRIVLNGQVANLLPPRDRHLAMVLQNPALFPHLTARENLALGLVLRRVPRTEIETRVRATAALLELLDCLERRPVALSGGQRQRVALGRALVCQPQLLLLDEPFVNLDAPLRLQLRRELVRLHGELRTTMIYVTHDQAEAMAMGDRVGVMNRGRLEQAGTPAELRERPATPFVAEFLRPLPVL